MLFIRPISSFPPVSQCCAFVELDGTSQGFYLSVAGGLTGEEGRIEFIFDLLVAAFFLLTSIFCFLVVGHWFSL